jgi:hypothetical protein
MVPGNLKPRHHSQRKVNTWCRSATQNTISNNNNRLLPAHPHFISHTSARRQPANLPFPPD